MSPWHQVAAQATQIGMGLVAEWLSDINMDMGGGPDLGHFCMALSGNMNYKMSTQKC